MRKLSVLPLVILLLLTFSAQSRANYPFFRYNPEKFKISAHSFSRYVKPQLRSMTVEYYHLLNKLNTLQGDWIKIKKTLTKMHQYWYRNQKDCTSDSEKCLDHVNYLYNQAETLDKSLLSFKSNKLSLKKIKEIDQLITVSSTLDGLSNKNYLLLHSLEQLKINFQTTSIGQQAALKQDIRNLLYEMLLKGELHLVSFVRDEIREDFYFVWENFFKLVERYILLKDDQEYLLTKLGDLNIAWNTFHMKMAKSKKNVSKYHVKIISIMHNRWNSILKIILRR